MQDDSRKQLESKLQLVLGELSNICNELGIELATGPVAVAPVQAPKAAREKHVGPVLLVQVGPLHVGFAARSVQELVRMVEISEGIEARDELLGYVNVRGQGLPVLSLRQLLGLSKVVADPEHVLVILTTQSTRFAVVVDEVLDIYELQQDDYQDREDLDLHRGFTDGVALIENELVAVINPRLLAQSAL